MTSCPNINKSTKYYSQPYKCTKTVPQLLIQLSSPQATKSRMKKYSTQLDVQQIRAQMKKKWRDPGYVNLQFNKPPILRAKLLNQWEYQRIYQAERSYKYPKNFKGIKYDSHSRNFEQPTGQMLPQKFNLYLNKVKSQYQNKLFEPGKTFDAKKQRITRMLTQNAIKSVTNRSVKKHQFFGYSIKKKLKTINC